MRLAERLRSAASRLRAELSLYRRVIRHERTPILARMLLWCAVVYVISPIDLVPDFIPVIGHLDDLIIVPALVLLALRMVPADVVEECRRASGGGPSAAEPDSSLRTEQDDREGDQ